MRTHIGWAVLQLSKSVFYLALVTQCEVLGFKHEEGARFGGVSFALPATATHLMHQTLVSVKRKVGESTVKEKGTVAGGVSGCRRYYAGDERNGLWNKKTLWR